MRAGRTRRQDQDGERQSRRMSISTPHRLALRFVSVRRPMNYLCLPAFCATNSKNGMIGIAGNLSCVSTVKSLAYATMQPRSSRAIYGCTDSRIVCPVAWYRVWWNRIMSTSTFIPISFAIDKLRKDKISRGKIDYVISSRILS